MRKTRETIENELVGRLATAVPESLVSVVAYGPAIHDDEYTGAGVYLLLVMRDLEPPTLRALADPIRWLRERGEPWPRMFTPALLREAADVFPLELLDIAQYHRVVYGADPITAIAIDRTHLRIQCERELREKLMRLREGYVESRNDPALRELLAASYPTFVRIFRGCLHLFGEAIPRHDRDVAVALCERLDIPHAVFAQIDGVARGARDVELEVAFAGYYRALGAIERRIDQQLEGRTP